MFMKEVPQKSACGNGVGEGTLSTHMHCRLLGWEEATNACLAS